jgi:iron complex outermembrane receptor protein
MNISAQEEAESEDLEEEFALEDVVVTAERRSMSAQKMPVSVVVTSDNDLRENGVINIGDMVGIIPSLTFYDHGNGSFVNIRGVGLNEAAPNQTNGVAFHLDGAYIAREFTADDAFFDLERVEVLRGPQGTYVGQNAAGGAVFLVTKQPDMENIEGFASVTFGDYSRKLFEGAVSVPVSDSLAFRVSFQSEDRDSFYNNLGRFGEATKARAPNDPGIVDRHLGRFQIRYQPSDRFDLRLIYQNSSRNTNYVPNRRNDDATWADPWTVTYDINQLGVDDYDRFTAIADWQAMDAFAVRFVTSYQEMDHYLLADDDGTSPYVDPTTTQQVRGIRMYDEYTTAEINLISTGDSKFQWTAGAVMLDYEQPFTYHRPDRGYTTTPDWDSGLVIDFTAVRKNYALFGEVGYSFTPTLDLKIGARYNKDETELSEGSYLQIGGPNSPVIIPVSNQADFDDVSGRIVLNWEPVTDHYFYLSVAEGYKPGGWEPFGNIYDSETVLNKEIGWKASFLDSRLMTSLSLFHMDYDGFQATVATDINNPATRITENIDGTTIQGVDFQMHALIDHFEFGLNGSYLDTEYGDKYVIEPPDTQGPGNPAEPTLTNLGGREVNWAPEFSGNVYLTYTFNFDSGATLVPRISWRYQGAVWTNFFQAPHHRTPSYSVGDIRLRYNPNANWYVEGYVTNFTDKLYVSNSVGGYPGTIYFGPPMQFGITAMYRF